MRGMNHGTEARRRLRESEMACSFGGQVVEVLLRKPSRIPARVAWGVRGEEDDKDRGPLRPLCLSPNSDLLSESPCLGLPAVASAEVGDSVVRSF